MKKTIILAALLLTTLSQASTKKMLYGADDRYEVDSFYAMEYREQTKAVATMAPKIFLWEKGDTYRFEYLSLQALGMPSTVNFSRQAVLGDCSGFLISDDVLVTAGHCITEQKDCDDHLWVFDYDLKTSKRQTLKKSNTAACKEILETKFDDGGWIDYAVIRLEKKFPERNVLKIRQQGEVEKGTPVVMIGYPSGLPMKLTKNAEVWHTDDEWVFSANLDAFSGNSGSPVFNARTKEVEGILVRGGEDMIENEDGTLSVNICATGDASEYCTVGEDITRITKLDLQRFID